MPRPTKREQINKKIGQGVSKLTDQAVKKLEEAFSIDASIGEACYYAGISRQTYYNWIEENPELFDKFERLRSIPVLKARFEVVRGIEGDKHFAFQYLKSKQKGEFGEKITVEREESTTIGDLTEEEKALKEEYEEKLKKIWARSISE